MTTNDEPVETGNTATIALTPLVGVVIGVVVVVLVASFAARLVDVAGLFLAAVALAVTTLPIQRRLASWIGRAASIAVTALVSAVGTLTVIFLAVRDLSARTERIAELVDRRFDELAPGSLVGRVVGATRLDAGVAQWLDELPSRVFLGGSGAEVATQIFLFLSVVVLAAFLQASGGTMIDWMVQRWPREATAPDDEPANPRREIRRLLHDVECRGVGAFRRLLTISLGVAVLVGAVASAIDLPGAIVLGLWVGVWSVAPVVGPPVAIVPALLLLALDQRPIAWVAVGAVVVAVLAAAELRRRWVNGLVLVGAGPYTLAAAAGVAVAGVGGSVVALLAVCCLVALATSEIVPARPDPWYVPAAASWRIGGLTLPTGWRLVVLAAGAAFGAVLSWMVLAELGRGLAWVLVGGFIAVALSRPAGWIVAHTRLDRRAATALVCLVVGAIVVAAAMTGADDGARATTTLTERLPTIVAGMEDIPVLGGWLEQRDASVWVEEQMNDLPQRVRTGRPADWLPFFGERLVDLFWVGVLAVALLVDGPRMIDRANSLVPARHRRQWMRLVGATGTALGGYAAGAALVASINAGVIFVVAVLLGLGVAPALALWGFLWNFVPQIGGFMGGLPLIVFALVLGPLQGLFAAAVFIAYQFLENHVIQPAVVGAAIDIAPWGTLLAAIAGAAAAGIVGAIVLTPLVGVIGVIRRDLASDDFPGAVSHATHDP